jgi:hypothetical protein
MGQFFDSLCLAEALELIGGVLRNYTVGWVGRIGSISEDLLIGPNEFLSLIVIPQLCISTAPRSKVFVMIRSCGACILLPSLSLPWLVAIRAVGFWLVVEREESFVMYLSTRPLLP